MSNIVTFKPRKPAPKVELPTNQAPQEALDYIAGLYEWQTREALIQRPWISNTKPQRL